MARNNCTTQLSAYKCSLQVVSIIYMFDLEETIKVLGSNEQVDEIDDKKLAMKTVKVTLF